MRQIGSTSNNIFVPKPARGGILGESTHVKESDAKQGISESVQTAGGIRNLCLRWGSRGIDG